MMRMLMVFAVLLVALPAAAIVEYDQDVTPDVIFGDGNLNGYYTTDRSNGVELGLRGKLRFDPNNNDLPANVFNSAGNGDYSFQPGYPTNGFSWNTPDHSQTPVWNFEFSVNTNWDGSSGWTLDTLTYELGLDHDPTPGVAFLVFDPITPVAGSVPDHDMGDNTTGNGDGVHTSDPATYAMYLSQFNVAQNSWNYSFFTANLPGFNPINPGIYTIYLAALHNGVEVSRTAMNIVVSGPVPNEDKAWGEVKALFR